MGGKLVTGRKRHIVVDTEGNLLVVQVHAANVSDRAGARPLLAALHERLPTIRHLWADASYSGELVGWAKTELGIAIEVVSKLPGQATFVALPRRWVVERSFAWAGRNRRLAKDCERYPRTTEGWIYLASAHRMAKRLTKPP